MKIAINIFLIIVFALTSFAQEKALTPRETLEAQKKLASEGKLAELWKMLPASWRQKVNTDFIQLMLEIPEEKRKDIYEILVMLTNTLKDKEDLLSAALAGNNGLLNLNEKDSRLSIISFRKMLTLITKSDLANQAEIHNFSLDKFISEKGNLLVKEVVNNPMYNALVKKDQNMTIAQALKKLSEFKVEGEGKDLKLVSGILKIDVQMQKLEGVWVPKQAVEFFKEYSKDMDTALVDMKANQGQFMFLDIAINGIKEQIIKVREAKDLDELMAPPAGQNVDFSAIERERVYQRVQAEVLGKSLAKKLKNKEKCLVIHHPIMGANREDLDRVILAIHAGLGDKVSELKAVPIKEVKDPNGFIEDAMIEMSADDFNKVLRANKDCKVVISMVPLPFSNKELKKIDSFKLIEDPKNPGKMIKDPKGFYPLIGIYNGYLGNLEPYFKNELIHVMTMWKPDPVIDEKPVPLDLQKAFDKRYTVITPENLAETKKKFPALFPRKRK